MQFIRMAKMCSLLSSNSNNQNIVEETTVLNIFFLFVFFGLFIKIETEGTISRCENIYGRKMVENNDAQICGFRFYFLKTISIFFLLFWGPSFSN